MSAIANKEIIANHAETRFNSIEMGHYMNTKVHILIENILTAEFQPKKQIFEHFAQYFEGHTPTYILNELENAGIVEKQVRAEGTVKVPYEGVIVLGTAEDFLCEDGLMKFKDCGDTILLDLPTVTIGKPYNTYGYRDIKGLRILPLRRAYYRLKGC